MHGMVLRKLPTFFYYISLLLHGTQCVNLEVGNVVDLLKNYGILAEILPFQNDENFTNTEFDQNLFSTQEALAQYSIIEKKDYKDHSSGTWKIQLYEDFWHFISSFFDNYTIEFVENIKKSLISTWNFRTMEQFLGVPSFYLMRNYSFLLIKQEKEGASYVLRFKNATKYGNQLNRKLRNLTENVSTNDSKSVFQLVEQFGSHYVDSFQTGDVIYQIIVHSRSVHECFKNPQTNTVYESMPECANTSVVHIGKIKTLSNSKNIEEILNSRYRNARWPRKSNLLLMKFDNRSNLEDLYDWRNASITGFNFTGINNAIENREKSVYIQEVLDNQMKLRDLYI